MKDIRKRALSVSEFCYRYGVCRTKAYEEMTAKRLPYAQIGRVRRIDDDDAVQWFDSHKQNGGANRAPPTSGNGSALDKPSA